MKLNLVKILPNSQILHLNADIFAYLINFLDMYSKKSLKENKSLQSYKYIISGLVFDIQVKE